MGEQMTANRPNTPVDKMTDDLQQFFRKMAEEEAEAGESADGGTAGESMDNDADMLANVEDPPLWPLPPLRCASPPSWPS